MTRPAPIRRALVAAALTAVLAGCTVTLPLDTDDITALPDPSAAGPAAPAPSTAPDLPPTGGPPFGDWIAQGWRPTPWIPTTDPGSGVTVLVMGKVTRAPVQSAEEQGTRQEGLSYTGTGAPGSITAGFAVYPLPPGRTSDLESAAAATAASRGWVLTGSTPVAVSGYAGLDARYQGTLQGTPVVDHIRYVSPTGFLIAVETVGSAADAKLVAGFHDHVAATMRLG